MTTLPSGNKWGDVGGGWR